MKKTLIFFFLIFTNNHTLANEAYFDLSEKEIQIQTDFTGKEIIIFGIFQPNEDTILAISGPDTDTSILKKQRIGGFWFNTQKVIYKDIPSLFFIASSSPMKKILSTESIIKEKLSFNELFTNTVTSRNFVGKDLKEWDRNLIKIKSEEGLYKEYKFSNIDDKLFQSRVFFPSNSIPGKYNVAVYQIKNKVIVSKKNRVINIKKSGIGEKIYKFAHQKSAAYGLLSILFAVLSGLLAATIFRRL